MPWEGLESWSGWLQLYCYPAVANACIEQSIRQPWANLTDANRPNVWLQSQPDLNDFPFSAD